MNNDIHDIAISLGNHIDRLMNLNDNGYSDARQDELKALAVTRDDLCRIIAPDFDRKIRTDRIHDLGDKINLMISEAEEAGLDDLAAEIATIRWGDLRTFAIDNPGLDDPRVVDAVTAIKFVNSKIDTTGLVVAA